MKNFIVIYHAPKNFMEQAANNTPEEMQKGMKAWMDWAAKCGEKLVDMGQPLMGGVSIHSDGKSSPSSKQVCGYSVLQAESMEEAQSLLKDHPHLSWDTACQIEVHESMPTPGS